MIVINENLSIVDFEAWIGAIDTKKTIIENDKVEEFDQLIEELFPDGLTRTQLNNLLWFEDDWIFEQLRLTDED